MASSSHHYNTRGSASARRLIKCFCNCTNFTEDDIQRIYRLSALATLENEKACKLLESFLEKEMAACGGDDSMALTNLKLFQCADKLLNKTTDIDEDDIEAISELGLPYDKERRLIRAMRDRNRREVDHVLNQIKEECKNEIELCQEFKRYKQAVLRKLQQSHT